MRFSKTKFKRARPLLGTFVEISLSGAAEKRLNAAATRAFEAVATVDRLMSFHQSASDLSKLNRAPANVWVTVHAHTRRVFAMADKFFRASNGVFDVRCGVVQRSDVAPVEISGRRIRKTGSFTLDLGGIAKGYAVDLAVAVLKRAGVKSGCVNAGGDLRTFGSDEWPIAVRHPSDPGALLPVFPLKSGALATSAAYFARGRRHLRWNSALKKNSVTVVAPTCMIADGLTKVVVLAPQTAVDTLRRFRSQAFTIGVDGVIREVN